MSKHLKVEYEGTVLFDGEVDEVVWRDDANGVTVTGRMRREGGSGSALIDLLSSAARRSKTLSGEIANQPAPQQDSP